MLAYFKKVLYYIQVPRVREIQKEIMADWSSGQDAALSRRKQGFDSPISC